MRGFSTYNIAKVKAKLNGLRFNVASIWFRGKMVWPIYKYVITSASVVYSDGGNKITAKGDNYARVIGTVEKRKGTAVEETYTNVELVPVFTSSDFYLSGKQIHAYNLLDNTKSLTTMTFMVKYIDEHEKESEEFGPMYVTQQANERLVHNITSCDISVQASGISCIQTVFSILPSLTVSWHDEYTSTYQDDYTNHDGGITIYIDGVAQVTTASHNVVYGYEVGANQYETGTRSWSCYGAYEGRTSQTITLNQGADMVINNGEPVITGHYISVTEGGDTLSARGGYKEFNVNSYAAVRQRRKWASDNTPYDPIDTTQSEGWTYARCGGSETRYDAYPVSAILFRVDHTNMGTNETTDYVKYVFRNSGNENAVDYGECNAANAAHRTLDSREIEIWQDACGCEDTSITLHATCENSYVIEYDSGSRGTDRDWGGAIAIYALGSYLGTISSGGSITKANIGNNKHSESVRTIGTAYGQVGSYTSRVITLYQGADRKVLREESLNHYIQTTDWSDNLAAGGTTTKVWKISSYRIALRVYEWYSDGADAGSEADPAEDEDWYFSSMVEGVRFTPSKSQDGRFFILTHSDMEWHNVTDRCKYKVINAYDSTVFVEGLEAEIENKKRVTPEYTTGFTPDSIQTVTSDGASIPITGKRSYVTEYVEYDSGYYTGGDSGEVGVNAQDAHIVSGSGASISGNPSDGFYLDFSPQVAGASQRAVTFYASFDDYGGTKSCSQYEGDWTEEVFRCVSFSAASSSVPATSFGQSAKVAITFVVQKQVTSHHDGVPTVLSWTASDRPHRITSSNSDFELYNATLGTAGDDIAAYSGDSIYVYPTSANTSATGRSTTLMEMVDRGTVGFAQDAAQAETITMRAGYVTGTISSDSTQVYPYVYASAAVHSNVEVTYRITYLAKIGTRYQTKTETGELTIPLGQTRMQATTPILVYSVISTGVTSVSKGAGDDTNYVF